MSKHKRNKASWLKIHARKRYEERVRKPAEDRTMREIANLIHRGKSEFISKKSLRVTEHRVVYNGDTLIVLFDKKRMLVITVWKEGK